MNPHDIVIEGTVQADGTPSDPFWDMMQSIWAGQKARGFVPRSAEQVEAERRETRERWEERLQAIERLGAESHRLREQHP